MDNITYMSRKFERQKKHLKRKRFKHLERIGVTVYFLIMFVIPIFVGSLFINDISTQSVSLMLIAGIGYIIWNAIQMSRIDNAIQKHWEEHLNEHWNEFDESTRRVIKRSCMRTDT